MSITTLEQRILRTLRARGQNPVSRKKLAEACGVLSTELEAFEAAFLRLLDGNQIVLGKRNVVQLPSPAGRVTGIYRGNERGFGFIIPDKPLAEGDLYVPKGESGGAITGDRVSAKVAKRGKRQGKMLYEARVTEVLERRHQAIVGELRRKAHRWFVIPDGNVLHVPIHVDDAGAKNAKAGDQVVVEITQYPAGNKEARGVILRILGPRGEPEVETLSIMEQYGLPGDFEKKVLAEARRVSAAFDSRTATKEREDLRSLTVITIDPVDARDFDDAISLEAKSDGLMELGVHIADVAHFVVKGGALDEQARERSNSIYLPGTVIPMLPEVLSNGVCSLQEKQTRLTKTAFLTYDRRGQVKSTRLANTVIRSTKRLTYEHAGAILDGQPGKTNAKVVALLQRMEKLAKAIRRRRIREGMLELDLPESELLFDDSGKVIGAQRADSGFSHKIIEMFMVEANEAVARTLVAKDVPALRRIHDQPRDLSSGDLRSFLSALGQELAEDADRFDLQALLKATKKTPSAFPVHLAVLRSMRQAEYSPIRMGHYALASVDYCHFTSPIRRYPDLTIHRLIDALVRGCLDRPEGIDSVPTDEDLVELGRLCGDNERRAESAGRELRLVLILRLLEEKFLGEEFIGVVTGVANFGVFVQIAPFLIDGLLKFDQLPEDWWEVAQSRASVIGAHSGQCITVGDSLKVRIARVHIPTRQLDLGLAQRLVGAKAVKARAATRKSKKGRSKPTKGRSTAGKSHRGKKPGSRKSRRR